MSIPIPTRFRWARHTGRLTADRGAVHVLLERTAEFHVDGLPDQLTEVDFWEQPDARGLLRIGCEREREMSGAEMQACRDYFFRALDMVLQVFGIVRRDDHA